MGLFTKTNDILILLGFLFLFKSQLEAEEKFTSNYTKTVAVCITNSIWTANMQSKYGVKTPEALHYRRQLKNIVLGVFLQEILKIFVIYVYLTAMKVCTHEYTQKNIFFLLDSL